MTSFLKCSVLVSYSVYVFRLNFTEKRGLYLITVFSFSWSLHVGITGLELAHEDLKVDKSVFLYATTSSDMMPSEKFIPQTSWADARKERITMLGEAMSPLSNPVKKAAERTAEVSVGGGDLLQCFPMIDLY